jgi:hypothetical protein
MTIKAYLSFEYWDHTNGIVYNMIVPDSDDNRAGIRSLKNTRNLNITYLGYNEYLEGSSYGKVAGTIASEPEWHKGCTGCWRTIWH